jgi:hypothetical protein
MFCTHASIMVMVNLMMMSKWLRCYLTCNGQNEFYKWILVVLWKWGQIIILGIRMWFSVLFGAFRLCLEFHSFAIVEFSISSSSPYFLLFFMLLFLMLSYFLFAILSGLVVWAFQSFLAWFFPLNLKTLKFLCVFVCLDSFTRSFLKEVTLYMFYEIYEIKKIKYAMKLFFSIFFLNWICLQYILDTFLLSILHTLFYIWINYKYIFFNKFHFIIFYVKYGKIWKFDFPKITIASKILWGKE